MIEWIDNNGSSSKAKVGIFHVSVVYSAGPQVWEMRTAGAYWRKELRAKNLADAKLETVVVLRQELYAALEGCNAYVIAEN